MIFKTLFITHCGPDPEFFLHIQVDSVRGGPSLLSSTEKYGHRKYIKVLYDNSLFILLNFRIRKRKEERLKGQEQKMKEKQEKLKEEQKNPSIEVSIG